MSCKGGIKVNNGMLYKVSVSDFAGTYFIKHIRTNYTYLNILLSLYEPCNS